MALCRLPVVLLIFLPLIDAGVLLRAAAASHRYSPCCASANDAYHHSTGRTTMLDLSVHPVTVASSTMGIYTDVETEPSALKAETAGSDSGMVRADSPTANDPAAAAVAQLPPLPSHVPWTLATDGEQELGREIVLATLPVEYNSAAALAESPPFATWPVAATDIFLQSTCPLRRPFIFLKHAGTAYASYTERTAMVRIEPFCTVMVGRGGPLLRGGQDYVSGHRLCGAYALLPLAGESHSLLVTHGPGLEDADESGMITDIYSQFPLLHGWVDATDATTNATSEDDAWTGLGAATLWAIGLVPVFMIPLGNYIFGRRTFAAHRHVEIDGKMRLFQVCDNCWRRQINWVASCCQLCLCSTCFALVSLRRHSTDISDRPCQNPGAFGEFGNVFEKNFDYYLSSVIEIEAEQVPYKSADPASKLQMRVFTRWRPLYARFPPQRVLKLKMTEHNGRIRQWRKVYLAPKKYTSSKIPLVMSWKGWEE